MRLEAPEERTAGEGSRFRPGVRAWIGFAIAVVLLAAAAWAMSRNSGVIREAWDSVRASPRWWLVLAVALPIANNLAVAMSFWVQMRRLGRVGAAEMAALIGAAWLLNYLPLRAGMVGRVAYHKMYHGIAVRDSVVVMVVGMLAGGASIAVGFALSLAVPRDGELWRGVGVLCLPLLGSVVAWGVCAWCVGRGWGPTVRVPRFGVQVHGPTLCLVFGLRYLDFVLWIARYVLVFDLIGSPISLATAAVLAGVCQLAINASIVGNGLGLREWLVALAAANLPASMLSSTGRLSTPVGLTADLVNRAAEIVAAVLTAVVAFAYLARIRVRRATGGERGR